MQKDDVIYRQDAIDKVADMLKGVVVEYRDVAEKAIGKLPSAQSEPRWIPCSERLPEEGTRFYLATIANRGLFFTTTVPDDVDVVRWDYDRRKGRNSWHWCTERTVIAWMPLPPAYQEVKE